MTIVLSTIPVLLVDDHPIVREGLRSILSGDPGIELVGEASSGPQALEMIPQTGARVVLLDIHLPGMSGLETLREVTQRTPDVKVVMLTISDSEAFFAEAMRSGASGYLLKDSRQELVTLAIRTAFMGGAVIHPPMLAAAMRDTEMLATRSNDPQLERLRAQLTPRELDVLSLLARGYHNKAISETLHLAEVTVKKYVQSVVAKVGVPDRTRAALLGARLGLGE